MPITKEEKSAYNRERYQKKKEEMDIRIKEWVNESSKVCSQKLQSKKKHSRIRNWKYQGIISDGWNALYERYINTLWCEECEVSLTEDTCPTKTGRCLNHDHSITDRDNVRSVLCNSCNLKRG